MYVCDDFFLNSPKIVMYTLFNGLILITSVTAGRGGFILFWKKITKQTKYNYTLILVIIKLFTIKNGGKKEEKLSMILDGLTNQTPQIFTCLTVNQFVQ